MRLALTLISLAAVIGMAAPARADDNDDRFLASLQAAGMAFQDPGRAVNAGKSVCKLVGQGKQLADVVTTVQGQNPGLHGDNAARFTAIAVSVYCPAALPTKSG